MSGRLAVRKTYKLFIGGAFPRSESGRTLELEGYNVARASRKDARDNFTIPEPTGVVAVVAPAEPALDGLVARLVPAVVGGNAVVVVASEAHPLAAIELAEAVATSDVPGGVVNVLTGLREELAPVLAGHMDVNAIDVTGADGDVAALEVLAAENVKRVVRAREDRSPWEIASFMELKTVWHPIGR